VVTTTNGLQANVTSESPWMIIERIRSQNILPCAGIPENSTGTRFLGSASYDSAVCQICKRVVKFLLTNIKVKFQQDSI